MTISIYRKSFKLTDAQYARCFAKASYGTTIFNPDKRRLQQPMRRGDTIIQGIMKVIKSKSKEDHVFGGAVLLHSLPGCKRQPFHTDYDPDTLDDNVTKPFGVIAALERNTKFVTPQKTYILHTGDILTFDGDEVHAGASYKSKNTRIHIYVDVRGASKRLRNKTWLIEHADPDAQ